jgi:hypothetical protein
MIDLKNQHICHDVDMTTDVKLVCGIIFNNPNYTYLPRLALCCLIFLLNNGKVHYAFGIAIAN